MLLDSPRAWSRPATVGATRERVDRRALFAPPAVALFTVVTALVATHAAGISFRDPDHVAAGYVVEVGLGIAVLIGIDIRLHGRERWTAQRLGAVALGLVSFYATYLAYRNLKGLIPLLRPDVLYDSQLAQADRVLFGGHDPAVLLHGAIGSWMTTQVMSSFYAAFIVFLPLSLALYLVFSPRLDQSLLFATALSVNWVLGLASYFLLPSLGPVYSDPTTYAALPHSEVTHLQQMLWDQRVAFLARPETAPSQAIAAFASLHVAMSFTALLGAYLLGLGRRLKIALSAWLGMTIVSTVYLGWHFFVDDLAGLVIGAAALAIACALTGFRPRRRPAPAPVPGPA